MIVEYEITELNRRLANMITVGSVSKTNYTKALVKVIIGEIETAWIPWLSQRAGKDISWWAPEEGEQVVVLSPSGDLNQGTVLMALYQDTSAPSVDNGNVHRTQYADGAIVEYNRETHFLKAILPSDGKAELVAPGGVKIVGDTVIEGSLQVSENTNIEGAVTIGKTLDVKKEVSSIIDVKAKGISLIEHTHAETGSKTGIPI